MSATVAAARLKEAAAWANRSIAARPAAPVMGAAVVEVADGTLTVSGWDWDTLTRHTAAGEGDLERTLVNGRLLSDIASRMRDQVTLERDGTRLLIRSARSKTALDTMPVSEYPALPQPFDEVGVLDGFADLIGRVAPAAGTPDVQPTWLQGVVLSAEGGELAALATDRYIVSHSIAPWVGDEFAINIPARRLADVARHIDGKVTLGVGNGLSITGDGLYASILATDEGNPNVRQYLAMNAWTNGRVDLNRADLSDAIDAVTPTVGDNRPVRLYFTGGELAIKSANQGVGESEASVDCSLDGDDFSIAISPAYLTKALGATPADAVRINFGTSPRKPVLVHGLTEGQPELTTRHVVMPIRVDDIH